MSIMETIRMVADVGVLVCIAGLFIYAAYLWINKTLKKNDNDISCGGIPNKRDRERHDELIDLRTKLGKEIQNIITTALNTNNWDRIHVVEFSNSVMSVAYLPFRYMTCTYEVFKLGKTSTGAKVDHLSTSLFTGFFSKLHENDYCMIDLTDPSTVACGAIQDLMQSNNETKSLNAELVSNKGKSLGYISIKDESGFSEADIEALLTLSDQISALLGVVDI